MMPKNTKAQVKQIPLEVYTAVTRMGGSKFFLTTKVPTLSVETLQKMVAYCIEHDPNGKAFDILESDGVRMPDEVQRYYGKMYLNALNALRTQAENYLASKTVDILFNPEPAPF
jgi:hypothetical protein